MLRAHTQTHTHTHVQALTTRTNEVADRLFAPFSKRVGVKNIREWEEQHNEFEQGVTARRAELLQQVGRAHEGAGQRRCSGWSCCSRWARG